MLWLLKPSNSQREKLINSLETYSNMTYDPGFYNAYKAYLSESGVRQAHDWIFKLASLNSNFLNVVDFGCGAFNEFFVYAKPRKYTGIDINVSSQEGERRLIQANYRHVNDLTGLVTPALPTAFVSLFSSEITRPLKENYAFYEKVFKELPTISSGLVSGFYYVSKKNQNPVEETGGILSYQTLEHIEDIYSDSFSEKRIILPVPSKMFGQDVFEVWKFFDRR